MKKKEVLILEKTMSSEERIRRAEEIYNRRKEKYNGSIRVSSSSVNVNSKPEYMMLKKVILQVLICLVIYLIFYLIKNSNYIFSENVLQRAKEFLSYDINFQSVYDTVNNYYNNTINWIFGFNKNEENSDNQNLEANSNVQTNEDAQNTSEEQNGDIQANEEQNSDAQENTNEQQNGGAQSNTNDQQNGNAQTNIDNQTDGSEQTNNDSNNVQNSELGIGGGTDDDSVVGQSVELSQMEIDANFIKANCSFILPLKGTITSRYGPREATEIVSGNHKGIDIAANTGTVFCAAMAGTVVEFSSEGSYGNHIYIQNGEVITLYAHCSKIYLQTGQTVAQGMQVGEVGETGNATGPHLHFEVRRSGRTVNPEYIMAF